MLVSLLLWAYLLPLGWLKLLWGLPRLKQYRMWALGVTPAYQGKAVDALIYRRLYEALFDRQMRMEVNYVLEDNVRMNNALRNLGAVPLRRRRKRSAVTARCADAAFPAPNGRLASVRVRPEDAGID